MLAGLRIRNYVLIEDCSIEWRPGFNVLTGETGAGKSVLISALLLLLGERGSGEALRDPSQDALLEAEFALDPDSLCARLVREAVEAAGLEWEEGCLVLARRIAPNGRSRHFINNSPCLLKTLQQIGSLLVDFHGQHQHQSLLQKSAYLPLLDRLSAYAPELEAYQAAYQQWKDTQAALEALEGNERERLQRQDLLAYQSREIDEAELRPGEDHEIKAALQRMQHSEKLAELAQQVATTLMTGGDAPALIDELDRLEASLQEMARFDEQAQAWLETWQPALIALRESGREIEAYAGSLEFDPDELNRLQERHYRLRELKHKYGDDLEAILAYRERIGEELSRMENADEERQRLQAQLREQAQQLARCGRALHEKRAATAQEIAAHVTHELQALGMQNARFAIAVKLREAPDGLALEDGVCVTPGPAGLDDVEFLISTIPGKPLRPLREIASGGEISRVMLALKCTFGSADPVPLMVFDEIDVGIGGETADAVAERILRLAESKQVISITHLPQIASRAHHNLKVEKEENQDAATTTVRELAGKQREKELARMLGSQDSAATQRYARTLLKASSS